MNPTSAIGTASLVVNDEHLADHVGSGDVPVLATPWLLAVCERATMDAATGLLAPSDTTVGTRIEIEHLAPSHPGAEIIAMASVEVDHGHFIDFVVEARQGDTVIGKAKIRRARVDRVRFLGSEA